jgi:hypothetical protein
MKDRFNGNRKQLSARRQKHNAMHWSESTADGLAALKTLVLNRAWDLYWQDRMTLSLVAAA